MAAQTRAWIPGKGGVVCDSSGTPRGTVRRKSQRAAGTGSRRDRAPFWTVDVIAGDRVVGGSLGTRHASESEGVRALAAFWADHLAQGCIDPVASDVALWKWQHWDLCGIAAPRYAARPYGHGLTAA